MSSDSPAQAMVEAFELWWSQTADVQSVEVELDVDEQDVCLNDLVSNAPGTGKANLCMAKICDLADEHGVLVKGYAWGQLGDGSNQAKLSTLKDWYGRLGFVVDPDPEVSFIYRIPRPQLSMHMGMAPRS